MATMCHNPERAVFCRVQAVGDCKNRWVEYPNPGFDPLSTSPIASRTLPD